MLLAVCAALPFFSGCGGGEKNMTSKVKERMENDLALAGALFNVDKLFDVGKVQVSWYSKNKARAAGNFSATLKVSENYYKLVESAQALRELAISDDGGAELQASLKRLSDWSQISDSMLVEKAETIAIPDNLSLDKLEFPEFYAIALAKNKKLEMTGKVVLEKYGKDWKVDDWEPVSTPIEEGWIPASQLPAGAARLEDSKTKSTVKELVKTRKELSKWLESEIQKAVKTELQKQVKVAEAAVKSAADEAARAKECAMEIPDAKMVADVAAGADVAVKTAEKEAGNAKKAADIAVKAKTFAAMEAECGKAFEAALAARRAAENAEKTADETQKAKDRVLQHRLDMQMQVEVAEASVKAAEEEAARANGYVAEVKNTKMVADAAADAAAAATTAAGEAADAKTAAEASVKAQTFSLMELEGAKVLAAATAARRAAEKAKTEADNTRKAKERVLENLSAIKRQIETANAAAKSAAVEAERAKKYAAEMPEVKVVAAIADDAGAAAKSAVAEVANVKTAADASLKAQTFATMDSEARKAAAAASAAQKAAERARTEADNTLKQKDFVLAFRQFCGVGKQYEGHWNYKNYSIKPGGTVQVSFDEFADDGKTSAKGKITVWLVDAKVERPFEVSVSGLKVLGTVDNTDVPDASRGDEFSKKYGVGRDRFYPLVSDDFAPFIYKQCDIVIGINDGKFTFYLGSAGAAENEESNLHVKEIRPQSRGLDGTWHEIVNGSNTAKYAIIFDAKTGFYKITGGVNPTFWLYDVRYDGETLSFYSVGSYVDYAGARTHGSSFGINRHVFTKKEDDLFEGKDFADRKAHWRKAGN